MLKPHDWANLLAARYTSSHSVRDRQPRTSMSSSLSNASREPSLGGVSDEFGWLDLGASGIAVHQPDGRAIIRVIGLDDPISQRCADVLRQPGLRLIAIQESRQLCLESVKLCGRHLAV